MKTGPWTSSEDALALKYLNACKSFSEVGRLIERPRSAVISRAHRKGWEWPRKKDPLRIHSLPSTLSKIQPREEHLQPFCSPPPLEIAAPPPAPEIELPRNVSVVKIDQIRENECRFIHGEGRLGFCCGKPAVPGRSWCAEHAKVVFDTMPRVKRAHS